LGAASLVVAAVDGPKPALHTRLLAVRKLPALPNRVERLDSVNDRNSVAHPQRRPLVVSLPHLALASLESLQVAAFRVTQQVVAGEANKHRQLGLLMLATSLNHVVNLTLCIYSILDLLCI
jgi:hypothetical protein